MKKIIALFVIIPLFLTLAACSRPDTSPEEDDLEESESEDNQIEVTLYFANKEYIETGNEDLEKLIAEKRIIEDGNTPLEEQIIKELMKGPESDKLSTVIPSSVKLLDVEIADGIAFVNFAQEGLNGGSMQESFTITQIVNSLTELDNVKKVQFLIDGEKGETLMGHFEIFEPFDVDL